MTTPENPYNGNPYTPGTGQPADETQQFGQPAQQPYGAPQEPMVGYGAQQNNDKWNGLVIAGFVCAFLVPIVGLILSIIGMVQINKNGGKSKGMAIAGIIVSVVVMVLSELSSRSMYWPAMDGITG